MSACGSRIGLEHRLDVFEPLLGFGHEGVFGFFVGGFVGGAEAEEGAGIVPGDGADRLLGDEVLAGGFGVFEVDAAAAGAAVGEGFGRRRVEEVGAAGHFAFEAAAAERGDEFFEAAFVLGARADGDRRDRRGRRWRLFGSR